MESRIGRRRTHHQFDGRFALALRDPDQSRGQTGAETKLQGKPPIHRGSGASSRSHLHGPSSSSGVLASRSNRCAIIVRHRIVRIVQYCR